MAQRWSNRSVSWSGTVHVGVVEVKDDGHSKGVILEVKVDGNAKERFSDWANW